MSRGGVVPFCSENPPLMVRLPRFLTFFAVLLLSPGFSSGSEGPGSGERELKALVSALKSENFVDRETAQEALKNLGSQYSGELVKLIVKEEDREVQFQLEKLFRSLVWPILQAWRSAVGAAAERRDEKKLKELRQRLLGFRPVIWPLLRRTEVCSSVRVSKEASLFLEKGKELVDLEKLKGVFEQVRYFVSPLLLRMKENEEAQKLLQRHLRETLDDWAHSPSYLVRQRAEEEFVFLGDASEKFLDSIRKGQTGISRISLERLLRSVRWRVWPELRERTGLSMDRWENLSWRERLQLVSLWRRLGGEDSIWVLKKIRERAQNKVVARKAAEALFVLEAIEGPVPKKWSPQALRILIILARQLRERGEVDRALKLLFQVVEKLPEDREAHYQLGFTLHLAKRYDEAVKEFQKAIKLAKGDKTLLALAYYNMACAMALSGRNEQAIEALLKAIEYGFRDREHLAVNDPDLKGLRKLPEFKKVLEALDRAILQDKLGR